MGNSSEYKYGPVQDYSIKMNMNNDPDRGWVWGVNGQTPVAAISTAGEFQVASSITVGSGGNSADWNTAYAERGSQIAGTGLTWDGQDLNFATGTIITGGNQWNPDNSANSFFNYNDENPTYNGKGHGAIVNIRGDGNKDGAVVRSGSFHAHHFQASSGFYLGTPETNGTKIIDGATGNITTSGTITATGYNAANWDLAHSWGDHSTAGYYKIGSTPSFSTLTLSGNLRRSGHNVGHLEGSYNNVAANSAKTNPIYTIGSSYNPGVDALANMYGIGYSHKNAAFINSSDLGVEPSSGWGGYIAADGNARIFLESTNGHGFFKGNLYNQNTYTRGSVVASTYITDSGDLSLSAGGWGMKFHIDTDANSNNIYQWNSDGVQVMSLDGTGNLNTGGSINSGGSFTASSILTMVAVFY